MANVFGIDNPFPQHLFKPGVFNGLYVNNKEELAIALQDGWSTTHIPQEYPKWIDTGETKAVKYPGQGEDGEDVVAQEPVRVLVKNKSSEDALLRKIASRKKGELKNEAAA